MAPTFGWGPSPACALGRVTALDPHRFQAEHWNQAPLLTRAADLPAGFNDLFSAAAVDSLVTTRGLRQPFFRLVRDGDTVGGTTKSAVAGSRTIGDLADADAVAAAYKDGATLVLQSLHRLWPAVGDFCRDLAADLGHATQCNAYITPAGNARGFDFHHDTHDVFVLQVDGRKHWQVHRPVVELPTASQPRAGAGLVPDGQVPLLDTVLEPGDCLYLPRGYVHAADTADTGSIHLTVGVIATTWLDLLSDLVSRRGPDDPALRRALPIAAAGAVDVSAAAGDLLGQARSWLARLEVADAERLVTARLDKATGPEPLGPLARAAAAAALRPSSPVRPRSGVRYEVTIGARVEIHVGTTVVSLPVVAARLVQNALAGPTTPLLAVAGDPACDLDDALVVLRRLLREGILVGDA